MVVIGTTRLNAFEGAGRAVVRLNARGKRLWAAGGRTLKGTARITLGEASTTARITLRGPRRMAP